MNIELFTNLEFCGIDWSDYPDLADIYIESGDYDGVPMDGDQLDELNRDAQMVYELYEKFS